MNMHNINMTQQDNIHYTEDTIIPDPMMEQQIARGISDLLTDRAQHLEPHLERHLLAARNAAVEQLAQHQARYNAAHLMAADGHAFGRFGNWIHHLEQRRIASVALVVMVMLFTLFAIQQFGVRHNIENSDAFLLASELPPEAYADKGFDAWIESN